MKKLLLPFALLLIVSCSPRMKSSGSSVQTPATPEVPQPAAQPSAEPVPDELVMGTAGDKHAVGKDLFERSCGRCHKLFSPSDYTKEDWAPIIQRMRVKARLTEEQGNQIYDYVASLTN